MALIVAADGTPAPPSEIVRRLKQVDDRLGLKYMNLPDEPCWAITYDWTQDDPRRKYIAQGRIDPTSDYDIMTFCPVDVRSDDVIGYLERTFVRWDGSKDSVARLISRLDRYNEGVQKEATKEHDEYAEELIEHNAGTLFREQGKTAPKFRGGFMDLKGKP